MIYSWLMSGRRIWFVSAGGWLPNILIFFIPFFFFIQLSQSIQVYKNQNLVQGEVVDHREYLGKAFLFLDMHELGSIGG